MEQFVRLPANALGSFIFAFIITWLASAPVRWLVAKISPNERQVAAFCALGAMLLVGWFAWEGNPYVADRLTRNISLCVAIGIHFLFNLAWAKYPRPKKGERAEAKSIAP